MGTYFLSIITTKWHRSKNRLLPCRIDKEDYYEHLNFCYCPDYTDVPNICVYWVDVIRAVGRKNILYD